MNAKKLTQIEKLKSKNQINAQYAKLHKKTAYFCPANIIFAV